MKRIFISLIAVCLCVVAKPSKPVTECNAPIPSVQQYDWDIMYANLRESYRAILDRFCYDFYYANFGKIYKQGSVYVNEMNMDQNTLTIYAKGVHTYYGKSYGFGRKEHQGVPFMASFTVLQTGIRVVFQKWYEPDLLYPNGGWETIDKVVPFDYGSR